MQIRYVIKGYATAACLLCLAVQFASSVRMVVMVWNQAFSKAGSKLEATDLQDIKVAFPVWHEWRHAMYKLSDVSGLGGWYLWRECRCMSFQRMSYVVLRASAKNITLLWDPVSTQREASGGVLRLYLGKSAFTLSANIAASTSHKACCTWLFLTGATCLSGCACLRKSVDAFNCNTEVVKFSMHL